MKLVYDFNEDIKDENLKELENIGKIKDIIPIIFPPCRNIYLFSKTINQCFAKDWGKKLCNLNNFKFKITSIYDSCGAHPLFFTLKLNPDEDITDIIDTLNKDLEINFNPSSFSFISSPHHIEKRLCKPKDVFKNELDNLLKHIEKYPEFIKELENIIYDGYKEEATSINGLEKRLKDERGRITNNISKSNSKIKTEVENIVLSNYIKFIPIVNVPILSIIFLKISSNDCLEKLKKLKDNPKVVDIYKVVGVWNYAIKVWLKDIQELYNLITELNLEGSQTSTKFAMRIWRDEFWTPEQPLIAENPSQPLDTVEKEMLKILGKNEENIILKDRNSQIGIFENKISGVNRKRFETCLINVRKKIWKYSIKLERPGWLQHIIFIKATLGRKEDLKDYLRKKLLGVTQKTFARRYYQITGTFDFIILLDSIDLKELEHEVEKAVKENLIEDIRISTIIPTISNNEQTEGTLTPQQAALFNALLPNADKHKELPDNSVRVESYNSYLRTALYYKEDFENINKVPFPTGTTLITELDPHQMLHIFIRFKMSQLKEFSDKLEKKQGEFGTYLKIYKPIHDPNIIMCILTANDFCDLFKFVKDLDISCEFTEVSLIFDQGFPCKVPEYVKCKPCSFQSGTPCEACKRYIIAHKKTLYQVEPIPHFKGKFEQPVKIAIIPIKITEEEFINLIKTSSNVREEYTNKILTTLENSIKNDAKIIVFPELSIPHFIVEKLEEKINNIMMTNNKDYPIIVIAGSHYKPEKDFELNKEIIFNVSPIFFYKNGITTKFEQVKNNPFSDPEINFFAKLKKENVFPQDAKLGGGRGCLKFDTQYGRFAVLICHDKDDPELRNALINKVDMLIVPSWDNNKEGTTNRLNNLAKENTYSWVIYANNGNDGGSRLLGPVMDKETKTKEATWSLIPTKMASEDIKYVVIGHGIKTWQNGTPSAKDDHYCYIHPKPEFITSMDHDQ